MLITNSKGPLAVSTLQKCRARAAAEINRLHLRSRLLSESPPPPPPPQTSPSFEQVNDSGRRTIESTNVVQDADLLKTVLLPIGAGLRAGGEVTIKTG